MPRLTATARRAVCCSRQLCTVAPGAGPVLARPHQAAAVCRGVPVPGRHQQRTGEPARPNGTVIGCHSYRQRMSSL